MARQAITDGADLIVVAGGDGTINEVAEGMVGSEIPLGILPAGTANVLASEMRVPGSLRKAATALLDYPAERISTGRIYTNDCEPRMFLMMAGVGLDAHIVYNINPALKRALGKIAYWIAGFGQFSKTLEEFSVRVDGRDYPASFALIAKVRNYGGDLEIASEVSLFDDEFEVVLFQGREAWRYVGYLAAVAANQLAKLKNITVLRTRSVEISHPRDARVYAQVDGEFAGHLPARIEIVPDALNLLVEPKYLHSRMRPQTADIRG